MKWIGLTGGLGSGKTTVANLLRQKHYPVIDADEIAREVVAAGTPGLQSVLSAFGDHLLSSKGDLERSILAQEVFNNPNKKALLESILHPLIRQDVQKRRDDLKAQGVKAAIYDIPLLFETQSEKLFDAILLVTCSLETQKTRLKMRNNWSDEEIKNRLNSQIPLSEKEQWSDFVIHNENSLEMLKAEVDKADQWIQGL